MNHSNREPTFLYSDHEASEKSSIAKAFIETRARLNAVVSAADNNLVKRFYNIDHNTYLELSFRSLTV